MFKYKFKKYLNKKNLLFGGAYGQCIYCFSDEELNYICSHSEDLQKNNNTQPDVHGICDDCIANIFKSGTKDICELYKSNTISCPKILESKHEAGQVRHITCGHKNKGIISIPKNVWERMLNNEFIKGNIIPLPSSSILKRETIPFIIKANDWLNSIDGENLCENFEKVMLESNSCPRCKTPFDLGSGCLAVDCKICDVCEDNKLKKGFCTICCKKHDHINNVISENIIDHGHEAVSQCQHSLYPDEIRKYSISPINLYYFVDYTVNYESKYEKLSTRIKFRELFKYIRIYIKNVLYNKNDKISPIKYFNLTMTNVKECLNNFRDRSQTYYQQILNNLIKMIDDNPEYFSPNLNWDVNIYNDICKKLNFLKLIDIDIIDNDNKKIDIIVSLTKKQNFPFSAFAFKLINFKGGKKSLKICSVIDYKLYTSNEHGNAIFQEWLKIIYGKKWLGTQDGHAWLSITEGTKWLDTINGQKWLKTANGLLWLETEYGQIWILTTQEGQKWIKSEYGLDTVYGRNWLLSEEGKLWLNNIDGHKWLDTPNGQSWISTDNGRTWINSVNAKLWLGTEYASRWLASEDGQAWLFYRGGSSDGWIQTPQGQKWLTSDNGLKTEYGQKWLETKNGNYWASTHEGRKWITTSGLETSYGKKWLTSEEGQIWLETNSGKIWINSVEGLIWITSPTGLETAIGKHWLSTNDGKIWLSTDDGYEWLSLFHGQNWLNTDNGKTWIATIDGYLVFDSF
jgi:hypothetical protein